MSIYKEASRLKLRFPTVKGPLSAEQLWDLNQTQLSDAIKEAKKLLKDTTDDDDLSFLLNASTAANHELQLRFDILKDVYVTKQTETDAAREAKSTKEHNKKILELIASKKDAELSTKSVDELEKLLK